MRCPLPEDRRKQWKEWILNQRSSGLSIAAWCRRSEIVLHHFYYWQKKLFPKTQLQRLVFKEIKETGIINDLDSGVVLECKGVTIRLSQKIVPSVLKRVWRC